MYTQHPHSQNTYNKELTYKYRLCPTNPCKLLVAGQVEMHNSWSLSAVLSSSVTILVSQPETFIIQSL